VCQCVCVCVCVCVVLLLLLLLLVLYSMDAVVVLHYYCHDGAQGSMIAFIGTFLCCYHCILLLECVTFSCIFPHSDILQQRTKGPNAGCHRVRLDSGKDVFAKPENMTQLRQNAIA